MAGRENMGQTLDVGFVQRVAQGIRYMVSGVGPNNFFGPEQPLAPIAQERSEGRLFDYPVGYNLQIQPRAQENVGFGALRSLADGYDLLRSVIETRKDQIEMYEWEIVADDMAAEKGDVQAQIKVATELLRRPDKENDWNEWIRQVVEEILVIDALAVYPRMNKGGKLHGFELVDGATIKRVLDETGRTPLPPSVAYQQILKGMPASDYSTETLVYMVRNKRVWKIYGYSPVEQIIMTVNIALRRQVSQLQFYTEGNIPEAIAQLPKDWPAATVKEFQLWWDSLMEGNTANKRKMKFIPNLEGILFPKQGILKDEFDEWLARLICFAFSIAPNALIRQVNRASGEQMADTAKEEGLIPLLTWLASKMTFLLQVHAGCPGVKFKWKLEEKIDAAKKADINTKYISAKVITPDEAREDIGKEALTPQQREEAWPTPVPMFGPDGEPAPPGTEEEPQNPKDKEVPPKKGEEEVKKAEARVTQVGKYVERRQPRLQRKISRAFSKEAKELADKIRKMDFAQKSDADTVNKIMADLELQGYSVEMIEEISPELLRAFKSAGRYGVTQVNFESTAAITAQVDAAAVAYAADRGAELVKGLTRTTEEGLRRVIADGVEKGMSPDKLADAVEAFTGFDEDRAAMIARTELAYAHVQGNVEGWKATGLEVGKRSILGDLHEHSDECDECADAGVVKMDEDFIPGLDFPPYHPNCVCAVVPVVEGMEDDD